MTADECRREAETLYDKANAYAEPFSSTTEVHYAIHTTKALWEIAAQLATIAAKLSERHE